jgi:Lrp/AsnC family leucine-responsive transcriptional regulator
MSFDKEKLLDVPGLAILRELLADARLSFNELAQRVGLSAPAVAERVRKLEEAGVIRGYRAQIDLDAIGLPILALIRLEVRQGHCAKFAEAVGSVEEVVEAHRVTGEDDYVIKVATRDIGHLESVCDRLSPHGAMTTLVVFSSPVPALRVPGLSPVATASPERTRSRRRSPSTG